MNRSQAVASRLGLDPRALVGLVVLIGGTLLWVLAFTGGLSTLFGSSSSTVRADFASVEDIVPNDPVRIHGVQVGTVSAVNPDPGGRGGTLTMAIDTTEPIYADASAAILWRTALGANDAVALDPGSRGAGLLGARTIPQSHDSNQVELDQITQVFHGGATTGMRTMLQQLAPALSDHPALGQALSTLARIAPTATIGIGALRGQVQDADLKALVRNAGQAAQAISVGTGAAETRQFVQSAATTLTAASADPVALRNALTGFAQIVPQSQGTFAGLDVSLNRLDVLLPKLIPEAPKVAPTLQALHPALTDAHTLLSDATPLLRKLRPTVDSLASTANVGVPVINAVSPSLQRLANKILPGLAQQSPEESHPVYELLGPTIVSLGTLSNFVDGNGELANLTAGLEQPQAAQVLPCQLDFSGTDFLVCQTLSQTLGELFTGGTSLLQGLARRPGGAGIYGSLLNTAQKLQTQLNATTQQLAAKVPAVAKYLFRPNHGAGG